MPQFAAAAILLGLLFVSTLLWARSDVRRMEEAGAPHDTMRARLWAAGASFAVFTVAVAGAILALFSPGDTGLARFARAYASPAVSAGLLLCAAGAAYAAYLCVRVWRSQPVSMSERLHLSLHLAMVCAAIAVLLSLPATQP